MPRLTENLTELRWFFDVHILDSPRATTLRRLCDTGWIYLQPSDTAVVELDRRQDPAHRDQLLDAVAQYPIALGPAVADHSFVGLSVAASDEDDERIHDVYKLLWPSRDLALDQAATTGNGRSCFRDAMHIATAIRYAVDGFITEEPRLLARAPQLAARYQRFSLLSPEEATARALREVAMVYRRARVIGRPDFATLPPWPPEGDVAPLLTTDG